MRQSVEHYKQLPMHMR